MTLNPHQIIAHCQGNGDGQFWFGVPTSVSVQDFTSASV